MSGYCEDCGNTICLCAEYAAQPAPPVFTRHDNDRITVDWHTADNAVPDDSTEASCVLLAQMVDAHNAHLDEIDRLRTVARILARLVYDEWPTGRTISDIAGCCLHLDAAEVAALDWWETQTA